MLSVSEVVTGIFVSNSLAAMSLFWHLREKSCPAAIRIAVTDQDDRSDA